MIRISSVDSIHNGRPSGGCVNDRDEPPSTPPLCFLQRQRPMKSGVPGHRAASNLRSDRRLWMISTH